MNLVEEKLIKSKDILVMLEKANSKITRATFERWLKSGYFPPPVLRLGRCRRWTDRQVKSWLTKCVEDAKTKKEPN